MSNHLDPKVISAAVLAIAVPLIMVFEGLYTYAYRDPVGIPTICFGHIEDVRMGDRSTPEECKQMLFDDLPRYEAGVQRCIRVPMSDKRHAAILSFTYNVGDGALCKSSVARHLNAGNVRAGCDALLLYNKAKGMTLPGLTRRRHSERRLCLQEDEPTVVAKLPAPVIELPPPPTVPVPPVIVAPVVPEPAPVAKPVIEEPVTPEPAVKTLTWVERIWYWIVRRPVP